ncbi:MAG: hypothetical protein JEZ06_23145 [Anaerolineaceae bacterium]|nr:hypothetical protein [Anaerolineaceae bacterium]
MNLQSLFSKEKTKLWIKRYIIDILLIFSLCIIFAIISNSLRNSFNLIGFERETMDVWFEADLARVIENMSNRFTNHFRTNVHPLFSIIFYSFSLFFRRFFDSSPISAAQSVFFFMGVFWTVSLYIYFRILELKRFDSFLFTLLGLFSSASIFWISLPEPYLPGSISIIFALSIAALADKKEIPTGWFIMSNVVTMSITINNWMVGLITTVFRHSLKKTVQIASYALSFVTLLWAIQKYLFPSAHFFLHWSNEMEFINQTGRGTIINIVNSFFFHTVVMPSIGVIEAFERVGWPIMTIQLSPPGSATYWGTIALIFWIFISGFGIWSLFKTNFHGKFKITLGIIILFQMGLHIFYGNETFLYALHFLPLLLTIPTFGFKTKYRKFLIPIIILLIITAGLNNFIQFNQAVNFYDLNF